jgi:hypothetical protein
MLFGRRMRGKSYGNETAEAKRVVQFYYYHKPRIVSAQRRCTKRRVVAFFARNCDGKVAEAMVTFTKDFAKHLEPRQALLGILPLFLLVRVFSRFLQDNAENIKGDNVPFQALLPTFHFDYQLNVETKGPLEEFSAVRAEVLLLGGSKSPSNLKHILDALSNVLPNVERVELSGLGHAAATDRGKPERVAQELRRFFSVT